MPYTHINFGDLRTELAQRLDDPSYTLYPATELNNYLKESLRTFGVLSGFWRDRGTLPTVSGTSFYDISQLLVNGSGEFVLRPTITDRDLILQVQQHLLESTTTQTSWTGTEMFTYADIVRSIERRRDQFLSDTGLMLARTLVAAPPPPVSRMPLADTIVDVRRAAWLGVDGYYRLLQREDEYALTAFDLGWSVNPALPDFYSILVPPPLTLQLAPPLLDAGSVELITVNTGAALNPGVSASVLGVPDDLCAFVKWGALADLLGKDGQARDPARAAFCEQRYQQGVSLARMLPCVLHTMLNGVPVQNVTLADLDFGRQQPFWENDRDAPEDVALAGWNLAALGPVPDGIYSLTLDVVRNTPIPAGDAFPVQVGREQLDAILDYAEHLALFKVGGAEFDATQRQAQNFLLQAVAYNQRIAAQARYVIAPQEFSLAERTRRPRSLTARGVGALPTGPQVPPTQVEVVNG